jgi:hypothetical protein
MPWYKSGTVSVTQNSNAVIGTGTAFISNARVGDAFRGPDGGWYEVTNIASDTAMSISPNYQGATNAAGIYALAPMQGYVKDSADALRAFVNLYGSKLAALGTTGNYDILPVTKGGTGGVSASEARSNLGLAQAGLKDVANTWIPKQTFNAQPVAAGVYGGYQISNNNGVQQAAFSMDWGNSNTYIDYYWKLWFRDSSNPAYPVRMDIDQNGKISIPGFVRLGEQAPAIKQKLVTGTCSGVAGGLAQVAHGLTSAKIIGIQALVQATDTNTWTTPGGDFAGYNFTAYFGSGNVNILNGQTNSSGMFGKPFKVLITYQE